MKVVAFNGSPRENGNTGILLRYVLGELAEEGIETELVQVGGRKIAGCTACRECHRNKDMQCSVTDDILNECFAKMVAADGFVLGSPTYFTDVTAEMKALIDRAGYVARANGGAFRRKVGAAVVAVRRQGALHVFDSINHLFLISEMIVPGSIYWNLGIGREPGEVEKDEEGIRTMKTLGRNMAWLLKKLHA
jgi:multimeric flavodoxin WrbA